jgi:hypothetical protein
MSDSAQKVIGTGLIIAGVVASGGLGLAALASYGTVMVMAGSVIYGAASQRQAKAEAEAKSAAAKAAAQASFLAGLKDRTATTIGTEQYHRTIYGTAKVGGNIVAMFTSGAHDEFKTCVVVFANHEVSAYTKFWVAGKYVGTLDGSGWVTGGVFYDSSAESVTSTFTTTISIDSNYVPGSVNVYYTSTDGTVASKPIAYTLSGNTLTVATGVNATVSYQYIRSSSTGASRLNIRKHLGTVGEAADSYLISTFPTQWTAQHTLDGHAYCVFTLDLRQAEFQGGPPSFQAEIEGKKLYDPRTSTTSYSENNALVLYDYLTGPYMKIPSTALPASDYIAAANDCDDIVRTGTVYPQSNKRYTFNGVISSNESPKKVLEQIAMSMCGTVDGNNWSVYAGKYRAPIMTLSQDDVVGGISITPGLGYQGTYNTVRGQYVSPATDYISTDFPPYVNAAYLAADGQEVSTDSQQPYVNNVTGIYAIERIHMEDSRNGLILSGDFSYKTWALRPGDRVLFSSTLLGMSSKIFRVTDKAVQFGTPIKLTLKEDAPEIWDQADALIADQTPNSNLGDPFDVPLLPGLTATSGTSSLLLAASGEVISRILVTWQAANFNGASAVDIQWRRHVSATWESLTTSPDSPATYLTSVIDAESYVIRARLRSVSLNAVGDWSYIDHTVVGKSEPPPDVGSLTASGRTLTWPPVAAPDLAGYILAFNYGTNTDWNAATPLNTGVITESPYALPNAISGQVTVLIKAIDTTGNVSANAAIAYTILDAPAIANILQVVDYGATSYPGTLVGGIRSGTTILASAADSFYGPDDHSFFGAIDGDSLYTSSVSSYGETIYTTSEWLVSAALAGSKITLAIATTNSPSYTLEYRALDLTSFYGLDGNSFYGPDADSLYDDAVITWLPWPGQVIAKNSIYQFRLTLAPNATAQPTVQSFIAILDAPDLVETLNDLTVASTGTAIPYTLPFTKIKNIQATLNANGVGGVTTEVDKTALTVKVYNSSHTAVSGATVDLLLRGY